MVFDRILDYYFKMALKFFNTLSRKKEVFKPLKDNIVTIYTCGPTVYDFAHIGNFRSFIFADVLRRYLEYKGFKVKQVRNITDVDDKTIKGSQKEGISLKEYTRRYEKAFFEDLKTINVEDVEENPRATECVPEMIKLIEKLKENGYTYEGEDGSIYFKISKFKNYGKLAKLDIKGLKEGASGVKVDEYDKENARDFALWKKYDEADGDVFWETSLGKGRPGWHIECSAMSQKYLGETIDIHTGGVDLIFPHHTNEIAQSEGASGKQFVRFWIHCEHLLVDGKKMSKSLGNFYTLRDLLKKGHDVMAIRYELMATHYRQKSNFTLRGMDAAKEAMNRLKDFMLRLKSVKGKEENKAVDILISNLKKDFEKKMDDDLNMSEALAVIFEFVKDVNRLDIGEKDAKKALNAMIDIDKVLGLKLGEEEKVDKEIEKMIAEREEARKNKDFEKADSIRERLKAKGIVLEDTPDGVRWKKV